MTKDKDKTRKEQEEEEEEKDDDTTYIEWRAVGFEYGVWRRRRSERTSRDLKKGTQLTSSR